jgi:hypothetical protein
MISQPRRISSRDWAIGLPCSRVSRDGHFLDPAADDLRNLQDDVRAICRRRARPDPEPVFGGGQGVVQVGARGMWHGTENCFVGRVDNGRTGGGLPFSADI